MSELVHNGGPFYATNGDNPKKTGCEVTVSWQLDL